MRYPGQSSEKVNKAAEILTDYEHLLRPDFDRMFKSPNLISTGCNVNF